MVTFFIALAALILGFAVYAKVVERLLPPDERKTPAIDHPDGVDYIPPFLSPEDQEALEPGDHTALVERIMEETEHTLMVADLGGFSAAALAMMELSDVVYMPVLEDFISEGKCGEFLDYLKETGKSRILERIQKLRLPQPGTIRSRDR